jgi:hypothetical protein
MAIVVEGKGMNFNASDDEEGEWVISKLRKLPTSQRGCPGSESQPLNGGG